MPNGRASRRRHSDSNETASGKPGAVHPEAAQGQLLPRLQAQADPVRQFHVNPTGAPVRHVGGRRLGGPPVRRWHNRSIEPRWVSRRLFRLSRYAAAGRLSFRSLRDRRRRSGRKTLVKRTGSGDFGVRRHPAWGISLHMFSLTLQERSSCCIFR